MTNQKLKIQVSPSDGLAVTKALPLELSEDKVMVKVSHVGICGSDLHYAIDRRNGDYLIEEPLTLGHEISGTIVQIGSRAACELPVGAKVVVHPSPVCPPAGATISSGENLLVEGGYLGSASTSPHLQGGLTDELAVYPHQLRAIPDSLDLRRAALAEPLAVALHGVSLAGTIEGKSVLVMGAGPVGLLTVLAAKHKGAEFVTATDFYDHALTKATHMGADRVVNIGATSLNGLADIVIEASGAPAAAAQALSSVKRGGTVVQLGILPTGDISLPYAEIISKEVIIKGSWRFDVELDEAISVLASHHEAEAVISHVLPIREGLKGFSLAAEPELSSKVLISVSGL